MQAISVFSLITKLNISQYPDRNPRVSAMSKIENDTFSYQLGEELYLNAKYTCIAINDIIKTGIIRTEWYFGSENLPICYAYA